MRKPTLMSHLTIRLMARVSLVLAALTGTACPPGRVVTPDSSACPSLLVDYLRQPTAVAAIQMSHLSADGHLWGTVDRSGNAHGINVDVVPQSGWAVPNDTRGLAFSMFVKRPDTVGLDAMALTWVTYILEYTLPAARCDMGVSWDADLSVTLPHGVCTATEATPDTCRNRALYATFDMFTINDPDGSMSLSATGGSARTRLEQAVEAALGAVDMRRDRLELVWNSSRRWRKGRTFRGNFNVASGASAHVYVGLGAQLILTNSFGWLCLQKCTTLPTDNLADAGLFQVDSSNGAVGIAMAKR